MGLMNSWGVHQHHLGLLSGEDGAQAVSCGLSHWRCDRHFFPHQLVEQRGFPNVRATDQGDKPGPVVVWRLGLKHEISLRVHGPGAIPMAKPDRADDGAIA